MYVKSTKEISFPFFISKPREADEEASFADQSQRDV